MESAKALGLAILTMSINLVLMLIKIGTGVVGNSTALIADGIESASDIFTSMITWAGYHLSIRPPDGNHPFGHGRYESLTAIFAGAAIIGAAGLIAFHAITEIQAPTQSPAWFTLPVLLGVVGVKWSLSKRIGILAGETGSRALEGEAWHHVSDAMTSGAAALGIAIALIGGDQYAASDEWAALFACVIVAVNGGLIIARSLNDVLDARVDPTLEEAMRAAALEVSDVDAIDKCRLRKSGTAFFLEIHVQVDGNLSVITGHQIGHHVKASLIHRFPQLLDVVVHIEPINNLRNHHGMC